MSVLAAAVLALHALLLAGLPTLPAKAASMPAPALQVRQIVLAPEALTTEPPAVQPAGMPTMAPVANSAAAPAAEPARAPAIDPAIAPRPAPPARSAQPLRPPAVTPALPQASPEPVTPTAAPSALAEAAPPAASPESPPLSPLSPHSLAAVQATPAASDADIESPPLRLAAAGASAPTRTAPNATSGASAAAAADDDEGMPPPTYAARPPPAVQLQYELRRGAITARGELNWRPAGDRYELQLDGHALGINILGWTSSGGFDAAGLAPQRFLDRRTGRSARAANFQRDKGLITYSSGGAEHPLLAGAQDRLSWMLQLAAIVEADPARYGSGKKVSMQVSGARGDADVWTFVIAGHEAVDLVGQRLPRALRASREPRKPFDTAVDVWLDPARHHLPVRLRLRSGDGGNDSMEFVLVP